MSKLNEERQTFRFDGSAPARLPETSNRKNYRTKVFKSGNSLAVRIPAGTDLKPGMEMDLTVEDGVMLALKPIEAPKRKIDISGFAGKAPWLKPLPPEMREFEERPSTKLAREAYEAAQKAQGDT
jgi:antitoxin VapB